MPHTSADLVSATSLALLTPMLAALDCARSAASEPSGSLHAPYIWLPKLDTVLCATAVASLGMSRGQMVSLAVTQRVDVVLAHHGDHPEIIDDVNIDVVLGRQQPIPMLWSMCGFRGTDGRYWLVPSVDGAGPSIGLDVTGLTPTIEPPYCDMFERGDGVARAARETVLSLRRLRRS